MKTIILTGGGTAGHCTPHFALVKDLKTHFDKIYYIGSHNGIEKTLVQKQNIPYFSIPTVKLKRSLTLDNLKIPLTLCKSVKSAKQLLVKLQPDVVFSKGGYVALPVTIACKKLNIPVVIHESDKTLGLANKIATKFSKLTVTTFPSKVKNSKCLGAIIREELFYKSREDALKYYKISGKKPVLLITGGSMGAKIINEQVKLNLDKLIKTFDVLHIVGKGNLSPICKEGYTQVEFTDMAYAYNACDIALSRAGSNTAFELIALKIPTLFIPLSKKVSRGDQIENARYFYDKGLCHILLEEDINEKFLDSVINLYKMKNVLINNMKQSKITIANQKIVEILSKY
ncbi:MAG: UDP-N-acetylglucosamine--N-acetylmuramyl-(pentapeptide) pyrophosphoryl-undecaprenol N-acetylglucosamine transferase [Clostridiales bacterium]|nr:UDP-N-acetylglucosamine--N-acetylmuramyl-(pentapeptide) pyrophosphoryl-undecaprenol N-acetylglucosamine transferase [Clostridiales bacterium]